MIKITLGVEGMMCPMCEAHVNDGIRNNFDVKKVKSSRKNNETVITAKEPIPEDKLREAIEAAGYKMTSYIINP